MKVNIKGKNGKKMTVNIKPRKPTPMKTKGSRYT